MTYDQALRFIHDTPRFASKPGLGRIRALLSELGDPHLRGPQFVHVVGTNGKGSAAAFITAILTAAGYRTGRFISPYLERFPERICLGETPISDGRLALYTEKIRDAVRSLVARDTEHPNQFELITAMALCYFTDESCDFAVLEAGLGGRFDATNVIPPPAAAAILSISLDHTKLLGNTASEIAEEKCGILKSGSRAVCYPDQPVGVLGVVDSFCAKRGLPLVLPDLSALTIEAETMTGSDFTYKRIPYHIRLAGTHQIYNALVAIETVESLRTAGVIIPHAAIFDGLANARWPGRLEVVASSPLTILDAAHNPGGSASLCNAIDVLLSGKKVVAIMGMCADKAYAECVSLIAERAAVFIATQARSHRAVSAGEIATIARQFAPVVCLRENPADALALGRDLAGADGVLLICGSIFLIGPLRSLIIGES